MKTCKQIFLSLFFMMVVTACANVSTTPTPVLSPAATSISTPVIVSTATVAPSETPIPVTPTEAGPKVGDTIEKNGFTYTYTEVKIPDGKEYFGYFRPLAVNLPLWGTAGGQVKVLNPDGTLAKNPDGTDKLQDNRSIGPINVLVEMDASDEYVIKDIVHPAAPNPWPGGQAVYGGSLDPVLYQHYFPDANPFSGDQAKYSLYRAALASGAVSYTFTYGSNTYTVPISPDSGATVYAINYKSATNANRFQQWSAFGKHNFSTAFWGTDKHGLVGAIASESPLSELSNPELMTFLLWHLSVAINNNDVTQVGYGDRLFQSLVQDAAKPPWVQYIIDRVP